MRSCDGRKGGTDISEPQTLTDTVVEYNTVYVDSISYVPKWKIKKITEIDTFISPVDTIAILKDYYAKYFYSDTLKIDELGYAVIRDTISRNSILSRSIKTDFVIPTKIITNTTYINKNEFYVGGNLGISKGTFNSIGGGLLYRTKNKHIYGLGVGFTDNGTEFAPFISGSIYWNLEK